MRPALTLARSLASARLARSTATLLPRAAIFSPPRSRSVHATPPSLASEVPKDPTADPELQSFYDKIVKHQGAVDAMLEIQKLMQEKGESHVASCRFYSEAARGQGDLMLNSWIGIDTSKPISRFQVLKLGMDEDMRTAGMKVGHRCAARRGVTSSSQHRGQRALQRMLIPCSSWKSSRTPGWSLHRR